MKNYIQLIQWFLSNQPLYRAYLENVETTSQLLDSTTDYRCIMTLGEDNYVGRGLCSTNITSMVKSIAECIERAFVKKHCSEFDFSGSGTAIGFDLNSSHQAALLERIERHSVISYFENAGDGEIVLCPAAENIESKVFSVFGKRIKLDFRRVSSFNNVDVVICCASAISNNKTIGIVGSAAKYNVFDASEHALREIIMNVPFLLSEKVQNDSANTTRVISATTNPSIWKQVSERLKVTGEAVSLGAVPELKYHCKDTSRLFPNSSLFFTYVEKGPLKDVKDVAGGSIISAIYG